MPKGIGYGKKGMKKLAKGGGGGGKNMGRKHAKGVRGKKMGRTGTPTLGKRRQ